MAEPAQDNPTDNQENQEILGVQGKIVEVFDHREARADQGPVDDAISDIVKLVAQDDEEQEQAKPLNGLLGYTCVKSLKKDAQHVAGFVGIKNVLQDVIDVLLDE